MGHGWTGQSAQAGTMSCNQVQIQISNKVSATPIISIPTSSWTLERSCLTHDKGKPPSIVAHGDSTVAGNLSPGTTRQSGSPADRSSTSQGLASAAFPGDVQHQPRVTARIIGHRGEPSWIPQSLRRSRSSLCKRVMYTSLIGGCSNNHHQSNHGREYGGFNFNSSHLLNTCELYTNKGPTSAAR